MSKILASIADAETHSRLSNLKGHTKTASEVMSRATAARAEHAEIVEVLRKVSVALGCACAI